MLLVVLDLVGIAVFAISGALAGVRARLDTFGVAVIGVTTALGGGIIRDVLLGVHPPATLRDWRYLLVPIVTSLVVFWLHPQFAKLRRGVLLADAVGLGLFTVSGTATALAHDVPSYTACLIGMTAGIGGGALRDVLLREIPMVLRKEIYALAALAGGVVVVVGEWSRFPAGPTAVVGAALIVTIRLIALWRRWNAPTAPGIGT
ncbi:trimeric intracellular cation channel family protein [Kibdelosporangium philippinense]|uniref:Trimeric intracellular cation channel family protein n=1 Tax=Kibdelosporangium philippinense TaxID=211113 RepID=A0ABS8ZNQ3_9PSEU|nr:trimeric intracellular cation channel family protein [Kibdelosporangium philippinense]MCE7008833.1 trimeric intracellular cation channel family protein [Kibdelosporangium philippinense]